MLFVEMLGGVSEDRIR